MSGCCVLIICIMLVGIRLVFLCVFLGVECGVCGADAGFVEVYGVGLCVCSCVEIRW